MLRRLTFVTTLIVGNLLTSSVMANKDPDTMTTSWYGPGLQGNQMANGDTFDMNDITVAAHKSLPFGTEIRLTNPENGRSIIVEVQDRGPYIRGRELDVSRAVARRLDFIGDGVVELETQVLD